MRLTTAVPSMGQRREELDAYLNRNVLSSEFVCAHYGQCTSSHRGRFYEGQLHHVGRFYELLADSIPFRVVVVGQEYGHAPARVGTEARSVMVMDSGLEHRFKADDKYPARNPHMRGTTNVLRLLFGLPLGNDHESEFLTIGAERVHIFEAFALVNYLLCSAVGADGTSRGLATPTMMKNCQQHFREALRILEPSVLVIQGKGFWNWVKGAFDAVSQDTDHNYRVSFGLSKALVAVFSHPSSHFPNNWGANCKTPYLLQTVAPSIERIRKQLL